MFKKAVLLVVTFIIIQSAALAQMGRGRVMGTVKSQDGQPLAGVTVTARNVSSGGVLETTSDDEGHWSLLGFQGGSYEFNFVASGYVTETITTGVKEVGRNPTIDVVLRKAQTGALDDTGGQLLQEGNTLFEEGKYPEALAKYQELMAAQPSLHRILFNIGSTYKAMGETDKAIESYEKFLEYEPAHTDTLLAMGDVLVSASRLDEAITYFEQAIDQTTSEVVPFNVAEIYMGQGNAARAIEYYQLASERRPDWVDPHLKIGYAQLAAGDFDAAAAAFNKVLEMAPDTPQSAQAQAALDSLASLSK